MMTIILFLVDTSASMNQRTYLGTTMLDVAKASVETFMKIRARDANSRWDRYMLLTFEDPPANVKAGWKESANIFTAELKNLKAGGLTTMGPSIKNAFDLLNLFRMQTGVDTYGMGRSPFYLESAMVIVITDGGSLTTHSGVAGELNLPMNTVVPGTELTKEPFRWDQRIFGLVLRLPASVPPDVNNFHHNPPAENSPIDIMCDVTGGRSYAVYSQKMINGALESLVQKVQSGVVINFEKVGPDPPPINEGIKTENGDPNGSAKENQDMNKQTTDLLTDDKKLTIPYASSPMAHQPVVNNTAWHFCRRLIYVPRSAAKGQYTGYWPIPEGFWPDISSPSLPPRTAHPLVQFSCAPCEPMVIENIPFDKYELEPSPLTQYILERRQPNVCWQTFVSNSAKYSNQLYPFGYLKASSSLSTVNLFVMPYNYPVLLPLLDELFKVHKLKPSQVWRDMFDKYLKSMPGYYATPLRRILGRLGAVHLIPESVDTCLSFTVIAYLKKLKNQAKVEMDRVNASVGQKLPFQDGIVVNPRTKTSILLRKDFSQLLSDLGSSLPAFMKPELMTANFSNFLISVPDPAVRPQCYRNPFHIPRKNLLDQVTRMRKNFLQTSHTSHTLMEQEEKHNVPILQMGNYQEQLKKQPPALRQIDNQPARLHMFGNPFKVKQSAMMVDEAEDGFFGNQSLKRKAPELPASPGPGKKRKPGPLPRNVPYSVLASPRRSPPPSPCPSLEEEDDDLCDTDNENELSIVIDDSTDEDAPASEDSSSSSNNNNSSNNSSTTPSSTSLTTPPTGLNSSRRSPTPHLTNHNHQTPRPSREMNGTSESDSVDVLNNSSVVSDSRGNGRTCGIGSVKYNNGNNNNREFEVWNYNCRLREKVWKEVKRPGRDFTFLFNYLSKVQGSLDIRRNFLHEVMNEAKRFKRKVLVTLLKKFEDSMVQAENKNNGKSSFS